MSNDKGLAPFRSLGELRREHIDLMKTRTDGRATVGKDATGSLHAAIAAFLERAQLTGKYIDDLADRDTAQGIIDYWIATLPEYRSSSELYKGSAQLADFDDAQSPDLKSVKSPYLGLGAFTEQDADQFYGREAAVKLLLENVAASSVTVVAGASGSGKSSLVLAGLLPRLRTGRLPGSQNWRYLPAITPSTDPLAALAYAVSPTGVDPGSFIASTKTRLLAQPSHFAELLASSTGGAGERVVIIVDQFEELFTICPDQASRDAFVSALFSATENASNKLILTIRDDFIGQARSLPGIGPFFTNSQAVFRPPVLSAKELRNVIERPARKVGLIFSDGVVEELVKEVLGEPTALPLLQFTLQKLWNNRKRNRINGEVYRKVGRPSEAVQRTAEEAFSGLNLLETKELTHRIFLELVQPSGPYESVRRRVRREAISRVGAPGEVNRILDLFVGLGLIRKTPGIEANDDRFEIAHEALIRNWPRLGEWLAEKRRDGQNISRLESAAQLWLSSGKKNDYLLKGQALAEAEPHTTATTNIKEFVEASTIRAHQAKRHIYGMLFAVTFLTVISLTFLIIHLNNQNNELSVLEQQLNIALAVNDGASPKTDRSAVDDRTLSWLVDEVDKQYGDGSVSAKQKTVLRRASGDIDKGSRAILGAELSILFDYYPKPDDGEPESAVCISAIGGKFGLQIDAQPGSVRRVDVSTVKDGPNIIKLSGDGIVCASKAGDWVFRLGVNDKNVSSVGMQRVNGPEPYRPRDPRSVEAVNRMGQIVTEKNFRMKLLAIKHDSVKFIRVGAVVGFVVPNLGPPVGDQPESDVFFWSTTGLSDPVLVTPNPATAIDSDRTREIEASPCKSYIQISAKTGQNYQYDQMCNAGRVQLDADDKQLVIFRPVYDQNKCKDDLSPCQNIIEVQYVEDSGENQEGYPSTTRTRIVHYSPKIIWAGIDGDWLWIEDMLKRRWRYAVGVAPLQQVLKLRQHGAVWKSEKHPFGVEYRIPRSCLGLKECKIFIEKKTVDWPGAPQ